MKDILLIILGFTFFISGLSVWQHLHLRDLKNDQFSQYYLKGVNITGRNTIEGIVKEFNDTNVCPAIFQRDSCLTHNPERALNLLSRRWVRSRPIGKFTPATVLDKLRNQYIYFLGDSSIASSYGSFVCYLNQYSKARFKQFWLLPGDIMFAETVPKQCPHNPDCYLLASTAVFLEYNLTIQYEQINTYTRKAQLLPNSLSPTTSMVIINLGLHYHSSKHLLKSLIELKTEINQINENRLNSNLTQISWHYMESFPQHFSQGYYNAEFDHRLAQLATDNLIMKSNSKLSCTAISNAALYHSRDWRNDLAKDVFGYLTQTHRFISIAAPLYSQWDAHVDYGDSLRVRDAYIDCTHYCFGSGVFRLVVEEIIQSLLYQVTSAGKSLVRLQKQKLPQQQGVQTVVPLLSKSDRKPQYESLTTASKLQLTSKQSVPNKPLLPVGF